MDELRRWWNRLRAVFLKGRVEREIEDEMRFHLEMEARARIAGGETPEEAARAARLNFGSLESHRASARDQRWGRWLDLALLDLRFAIRQLRQSPGFTAIVLVTLTIGIGANTAIFSVVDAALLRPLPYDSPERSVWIQTRWKGSPRASISPAEYLDYRDRTADVFSAVGVYAIGEDVLTGDGPARRVPSAYVTEGVLPALAADAVLGRGLTAAEVATFAPTVLISDAFWRQRFGGSREAIGGTLRLDGRDCEVVGVLPPGFRLPGEVLSGRPAVVWRPLGLDPTQVLSRGSHFLSGVARLREGVSVRTAAAALEVLTDRFRQEYPDAYPADMEFRATAIELDHAVRGSVQRPVLVLAGAVGLVLLVACANLAAVLSARWHRRRRELAVRAALGADRARLVAQSLVETLLVAAVGGGLGIVVAVAATRALASRLSGGIPWIADIAVDRSVLLFAVVLSLVTGLLFGLVPAMRRRPHDLAVRGAGRGLKGSRRDSRGRRALVVAEIALALVLLTGAGLFTRTFMRLLAVDPGFSADSVVAARISLPDAAYPDNETVVGFYRSVVEQLQASPAVRRAGAVTNLPLATRLGDMSFEVEGRPIPETSVKPNADWQAVTPGYFEAIGLPVLRGRGIEARDRHGSVGVLVINETFAKEHWPGEDPLGRRIRLGGTSTEPRVAEVVGVVRDVRHESLTAGRRPQMYLAHAQFRSWDGAQAMDRMTLVVSSSLPPPEARSLVTEVIGSLDRDLPVDRFTTMEEVRRASVAVPRLLLSLVSAFAVAALLLSAVGIYGVMAMAVCRRIPEMGLRMALGARRGEIVRLVLAEGGRMTGLGIAGGLVAAMLLSRSIVDLLFEVSPVDPLTLAVVVSASALTATVACIVPSWRASRVDPASLLRSE